MSNSPSVLITCQDPNPIQARFEVKDEERLKRNDLSTTPSLRPVAWPVKMVYDWSGKRDICLQKYVAERQTIEQVMKYFKDEKGFEPR